MSYLGNFLLVIIYFNYVVTFFFSPLTKARIVLCVSRVFSFYLEFVALWSFKSLAKVFSFIGSLFRERSQGPRTLEGESLHHRDNSAMY